MTPSVSSPAPLSRWFALSAVSLAAFTGSLMSVSIEIALPTLARSFGVSFVAVQWVLLAFLLANTVLLPVIGKLGDTLGKKRLFLSSYLVFTLGTLLCGLAPNVWLLIGCRVVQGVGAATVTALGFAVIGDLFAEGERGRALGIDGALLSLGLVLGPSLGGFVIDALSWRWVFLGAVPLCLLGIGLGTRFIPPDTPRSHKGFDYAGAGTLFSVLLCLLFALTLGQTRGIDDTLVLTLVAASTLSLMGFVFVERRARDPLLELGLFSKGALTVSIITGLVVFLNISGMVVLMPFYLESVLGFSPRQVGLLLVVPSVGLTLSSPLAGILADRLGARPVSVAGLLLLLGGYLAVGDYNERTTALGFALRFLPLGLGMGFFSTPNNSAIMGAVPPFQTGVAGGLLTLSRTLGTTLGVAVLGAVYGAGVSLGVEVEVSGAVQVAALQDAVFVAQGLTLLTLVLAVGEWVLRCRKRGSKHEA